MKKVKIEMISIGVRFVEEGRDWILPGLLYTDGLVLCDELEEDLKIVMVYLLRCVGEEYES